MKHLDLLRLHQAEYAPRARPIVMEIPAAHYLAVTGKGEPSALQISAGIDLLVQVGEFIQALKQAAGHEFALPPPELLVWSKRDQNACTLWKALLRMPEFVSARDLAQAWKQRRPFSRAVRGIELERLEERLCLQVSAPTTSEAVARLGEKARILGMRLGMPRHEIYAAGKHPPGDAPALVRYPLLGSDDSVAETGPRGHKTRARREPAFRAPRTAPPRTPRPT